MSAPTAKATRIVVASGDDFEGEQILHILRKQPDIEVVGVAQDALEASHMAVQLEPDVVLLDVELGDTDGLSAAETIGLAAPQVATVLMSGEAPEHVWRQVMRAGAKDILSKPLAPEELLDAIRRIRQARDKRLTREFRTLTDPELMPRVIAISGAKGGVGKTTVAVNMAVALAQQHPGQTVLVDAYLQFGDVALMLNLRPSRTLLDMVPLEDDIDEDLVEAHLTQHESGLKVLVAANDPTELASITVKPLSAVLTNLKRRYRFVVIDVPPLLYETTLHVLTHATAVVLVANLFDLTTLHDTRKLHNLLTRDYVSKDRVHVVLNRVARHNRLQAQEIESAFGRHAAAAIPNAAAVAVSSVNEGMPFVISHPEAAISRSIRELAEKIIKVSHNGPRALNFRQSNRSKWPSGKPA